MEKTLSSDTELLAEWLSHHHEPAFRALVARYAGLVHAAAKRTSGDEALAAEASQLAFIQLARKAKSLTSRTSLAGWLHLTAVMEAKNLIRRNRRENHKRQILHASMDIHSSNEAGDAWEKMQPVLDEALSALTDKDREALILRFYRTLSMREIAEVLGISTEATQKRIERATQRLRGKLIRHGCEAGGGAFGGLVGRIVRGCPGCGASGFRDLVQGDRRHNGEHHHICFSRCGVDRSEVIVLGRSLGCAAHLGNCNRHAAPLNLRLGKRNSSLGEEFLLGFGLEQGKLITQ